MSTQLAGGGTGTSDNAVAQEIILLERQRAEAYVRRDIPTLERLLPEHFTLTRAAGSFGKGELLLLIESGLLTFESLIRRVEAVKVYPGAAVAFGQDAVKARYKDEDISGLYRFTNTYVCDGGRWAVVATHSSLIPQLKQINAIVAGLAAVYAANEISSAGCPVCKVRRDHTSGCPVQKAWALLDEGTRAALKERVLASSGDFIAMGNVKWPELLDKFGTEL